MPERIPTDIRRHIEHMNLELAGVQQCLQEHGVLLEKHSVCLDNLDKVTGESKIKLEHIEDRITEVKVHMGKMSSDQVWLKWLILAVLGSLLGISFFLIQQHVIPG